MIQPEIAVFGGSGFYRLLEGATRIKVDTPYGPPSDAVTVAEVNGRGVAFMPRHGAHHDIPPHRVNYRANVWAFHKLGVKAVISPCAVGSLQVEMAPGDFVVCDQYVDRTKHRADTFYDGPITTYTSPVETYHPELRKAAVEAIRAEGRTAHDGGTIVVIEGPRFSTKAESEWFTKMGWHVVNMTQYPEAQLCRELGMSVVNISLVTDYDSGVVVDRPPVTAHEVLEEFKGNADTLRRIVLNLIDRMPADLGALGAKEALQWTRGDIVSAHPDDIRLYQ